MAEPLYIPVEIRFADYLRITDNIKVGEYYFDCGPKGIAFCHKECDRHRIVGIWTMKDKK